MKHKEETEHILKFAVDSGVDALVRVNDTIMKKDDHCDLLKENLKQSTRNLE